MMVKVQQPPDPWQRTTTEHGFFADEVISALQKCTRRGMTDNVLLLGWEMFITSPEMEEMMWSRLCVMAVEDIGLGNPNAPILVETLYQQHKRYPRPAGDRFLFAAHAIRVLTKSEKDRTSDDMVNWAKRSIELGDTLPEIPDVALDMHTRRGQEMGRDYLFFMSEASKVVPEIKDKDQKYKQWILKALADGRLA
ncbi:AAA family ATPase [Pleomorphomonas carboxyditropha]|uniref:AAA family ATPase n=1 Tax=Pleomorphomonas carboxyditropha TaxID=2023338 RepID=A0A2G9X0I4_9HYPH|nr:AAA family ATPase [Pleomorphomonas carboxyditropha]PIP00435.1 AAA family ATPase [Pleomorphomonas carboxyditropha]